jgi:hypothetical protein
MPCLNKSGSGKRPQTVWGNPKKESIAKFTNETQMVVEIQSFDKKVEPIQMLEKTERKYNPGERLIKESKHILKESKKKDKPKKRSYKNSISELLEELFVD